MGSGGPTDITSPWVFQAADYLGNVIRITLPFDETTGALQNSSVYRDADCAYAHVYIGLGPDGTPNTSPYQVLVPSGTTPISAGQLNAVGLNVISNVTALQITAGP